MYRLPQGNWPQHFLLRVGCGWTWQAIFAKAIRLWVLWGDICVSRREECQQTNPCEGLVGWWRCKLHCVNSKLIGKSRISTTTMDIHAKNSWWWLCYK